MTATDESEMASGRSTTGGQKEGRRAGDCSQSFLTFFRSLVLWTTNSATSTGTQKPPATALVSSPQLIARFVTRRVGTCGDWSISRSFPIIGVGHLTALSVGARGNFSRSPRMSKTIQCGGSTDYLSRQVQEILPLYASLLPLIECIIAKI